MSYGHPVDWVISGVSVVSAGVIVAAMAVVLRNRDFLPFSLKQIPILIILCISSFFYSIGSIFSDNHIPRIDQENFFWAGCSFWRVWLQVTLGIGLWLCALIMRALNLYKVWVLSRRRLPGRRGFLYEIGLLWSPWIIFAIVSESLEGMSYKPSKLTCDASHSTFSVVIFLLMGIYAIAFVSLVIRLNRARLEDSYCEYTELLIGIVVLVILAVANLVLFGLKSTINASLGDGIKIFSRFLKTFSGLLAMQWFFWTCVGPGMYLLIKLGKVKGAEAYTKIRTEKWRLIYGQGMSVSQSGNPRVTVSAAVCDPGEGETKVVMAMV